MTRVLLLLTLLAAAGCSSNPPLKWTDAPWTPDPQAVLHNTRVCAERGLCFDAARYRCEACK